MTRYVVVGAGAVGATLAAELHLAGRQVVLVARGAQLAALRGGLRYLRPEGEQRVGVPVAGQDEVTLRADDVLLLATKAQDADAALAHWAARPVAGGTAAASLPVVVLQNGMDTEWAALRRFTTVYGAVVRSPTTYLTPGEVVSPGAPAAGLVWLGRYPAGRDARAEEIAADLTGGPPPHPARRRRAALEGGQAPAGAGQRPRRALPAGATA
ncbi:ketopantoate reductase family protein [Pseudonocardia sp. ICBG601]|uniref:ketopantoate reductase family protein n=1 Tax=Pseudonocardia sp. ICBG601 TaxID=2846759 RepID=UPI001CF7012E|nr:2-dehydropantoate 2-reductase N-terminal domain-containing protein [Pseudonocardia sp. ICBG601]